MNDSIKAKDLFYDEVAAFKERDETLKQIFYLLLNGEKEFHSFFDFISYTSADTDLEKLIRQKFKKRFVNKPICRASFPDHQLSLHIVCH